MDSQIKKEGFKEIQAGNYGFTDTFLVVVRIKEKIVVVIEDDTSSKENVKVIGKVNSQKVRSKENQAFDALIAGKIVFVSNLLNVATKNVEGTYV